MRKRYLCVLILVIMGCDRLVGPEGAQGLQGEQGPPGAVVEELTYQVTVQDKAQVDGSFTIESVDFFEAGKLLEVYVLYPPTHPTQADAWIPGNELIEFVSDGSISIFHEEIPESAVLYFYKFLFP